MTSKSYARQSTAGFSLVEMITVIVIIGVLAAIAAPGWLAFSNRQRANSLRDQVFQALRQTQAEAKRTRRGQSLVIDTTVDPPTLQIKPADPSTTIIGVTEQLGNGRYEAGELGLDSDATTISFDGQGNVDLETILPADTEPPIKITVTVPPTTGVKRCVFVETLLGSLRTAADSECN